MAITVGTMQSLVRGRVCNVAVLKALQFRLYNKVID